MTAKTLEALDNLVIALSSDSRIIELAKEEEELGKDEAAFTLAKKKDEAFARYMTLRLENGEKDEQTEIAKRELSIAKKEMDLSPAARRYRKAYAEVSALYRQMDEILFGEFRQSVRCGMKHD